MMDIFSGWIMRLVGTALVSAAAITLSPEGAAKRVVRIVCGFAAMAALMSIAVDFDFTAFSGALSKYKLSAEEVTEEGREISSNMTRAIIEEKCAAYILDKAESEGAAGLEVKVSALWDTEGYWYPGFADVIGDITEDKKEVLIKYMESELGIPEENQTWSTEDGK